MQARLFANRIQRFISTSQTMKNMFVISLEYKVDMQKVDAYLSEHLVFLDHCYNSGIFIASGRKEPRTGGIILASANSKDILDVLMQDDPFIKNGIAEFTITEFTPTRYDNSFSHVIDKSRVNNKF